MSAPSAFQGSIPENYDRYLGSLLFQPYAADLARRVRQLEPKAVLEIACGTGIVTKRLRESLPGGSTVVASDLNTPMIDYARSKSEMPDGIDWREADAQSLPFPDDSFDVVVCQFGYMFLPDKPKGFSEAFRVLKPAGRLLFSTWDRLEVNGCAAEANQFLSDEFPESPPTFLHTPYGWNDVAAITSMLGAAGFAGIRDEAVAEVSVAPSGEVVATGILLGTPAYGQLVERGLSPSDYIPKLAERLRGRFGPGEIRAPMQAIVFEASKPRR